jgi:hypothetical protein
MRHESREQVWNGMAEAQGDSPAIKPPAPRLYFCHADISAILISASFAIETFYMLFSL